MDNSVHEAALGFAGFAEYKLGDYQATLLKTLACHLAGPTGQLFSVEALL